MDLAAARLALLSLGCGSPSAAAAAGLGREALAALISRESLSTAAIEGEQLPPDTPGSLQREASAKVEGLVQLLLASTAELDEPVTLAGGVGCDRPGNIAFRGAASRGFGAPADAAAGLVQWPICGLSPCIPMTMAMAG